jgi:hypothetical protein
MYEIINILLAVYFQVTIYVKARLLVSIIRSFKKKLLYLKSN